MKYFMNSFTSRSIPQTPRWPQTFTCTHIRKKGWEKRKRWIFWEFKLKFCKIEKGSGKSDVSSRYMNENVNDRMWIDMVLNES